MRAEADPERGHALWRHGRDELFISHPQSPLPPGDPLRATGPPYWPYDPRLRFEVPVHPAGPQVTLSVPTSDGVTPMTRIGQVHLPPPLDVTVDVWWLRQYAVGLFLPLRDGTAGRSSYGGGLYALDTVKGADLSGRDGRLVIDLNFLYHPSCRYSEAWLCLLAPPANIIASWSTPASGCKPDPCQVPATTHTSAPDITTIAKPPRTTWRTPDPQTEQPVSWLRDCVPAAATRPRAAPP